MFFLDIFVFVHPQAFLMLFIVTCFEELLVSSTDTVFGWQNCICPQSTISSEGVSDCAEIPIMEEKSSDNAREILFMSV